MLELIELQRRQKEEKLRYFVPNPGPQREFLADRHRILAFFGGNRTGKTVGGSLRDIGFALGKDGEKYYQNLPAEVRDLFMSIQAPTKGWICGESAKTLREVVVPEFFKWMPKNEIKKVIRGVQDTIDKVILVNGSEINFMSYEMGRDKFQGASLDWIHFDEEPPEDIFTECRMRVLDRAGWIWFTMTPLKGLTFTYAIFVEGNYNGNKMPEYLVNFHIASWSDNPHLPKSAIAELEATISESELAARRDGFFLSRSGLVYSEWVDNINGGNVIHFRDIPEWGRVICAIDPGIADPFAVLWAYVEPARGHLILFDEYYIKDKPIDYHASVIKERNIRFQNVRYLIDPSATKRNPKDLSSIHTELAREGIHCGLADNSIDSGITKVKARMKSADGIRSLFVMEGTCPIFRSELKRYEWQRKRDDRNVHDKPKDVNNHLMDCLRYIVASHPSPLPAPEKETPPPNHPFWAAEYEEITKGQKVFDPVTDMF
jgi:phage terminase large subunit-like protein